MGGMHASAAALGGFGHLMVSHMSDNVPALHFARAWGFHGPASLDEDPHPPSIVVTEHSIMTSFGHDEQAAFHHLLTTVPDKPISIVMDAYDLFKAINTLGIHFRDDILKRPQTAPIVVRPDSGDPTAILPKTLEMLAEYFGTTETEKGYKLLNPRVRVIQGDGISIDTLGLICEAVVRARFALGNLTFGSGGGLLQSATRDTLKFAYKASAGVCADKSVVLMAKDPITDPGKKSKAGFLWVAHDNGMFRTFFETSLETYAEKLAKSALVTYYEDGLLANFYTVREMRARTTFSDVKKRKRDDA